LERVVTHKQLSSLLGFARELHNYGAVLANHILVRTIAMPTFRAEERDARVMVQEFALAT
jgi:hypothetical protein